MKDLGLREGDDFELRLQNRHPVWEFKVQYEETDANFLRRVCEHEGSPCASRRERAATR